MIIFRFMTDIKDEILEFKNDTLLYYWITKNFKLFDSEVYQLIKDRILKNYMELPSIIEYPIEINYIDKFVDEILTHATKNSLINYLLIHFIEPIISKINFWSMIIILISGAIFVININTYDDINLAAPYAIILILSILIKKYSYKVITKLYLLISKKVTPNDLLKILNRKDHVYEKKITINPLDNSRLSHLYNSTSTFLSKKETVCRTIIKKYSNNEFKISADLLTVFFAINFVVTLLPESLERNNLYEMGINVLYKIFAFQRKSKYVNYFLGIYHFELKKYNETKEFLINYLELNKNDYEVIALYHLVDFYTMIDEKE